LRRVIEDAASAALRDAPPERVRLVDGEFVVDL
jgi:hypothetical protein